jgi:hypothetical protein
VVKRSAPRVARWAILILAIVAGFFFVPSVRFVRWE